jgi:hypothetical protein
MRFPTAGSSRSSSLSSSSLSAPSGPDPSSLFPSTNRCSSGFGFGFGFLCAVPPRGNVCALLCLRFEGVEVDTIISSSESDSKLSTVTRDGEVVVSSTSAGSALYTAPPSRWLPARCAVEGGWSAAACPTSVPMAPWCHSCCGPKDAVGLAAVWAGRV